ncbi:hypothetical protein [Nostoc sp.]
MFLKAFLASAFGWRSQEGGRNSAIAQKKRWAIQLFLWARGSCWRLSWEYCLQQELLSAFFDKISL